MEGSGPFFPILALPSSPWPTHPPSRRRRRRKSYSGGSVGGKRRWRGAATGDGAGRRRTMARRWVGSSARSVWGEGERERGERHGAVRGERRRRQPQRMVTTRRRRMATTSAAVAQASDQGGGGGGGRVLAESGGDGGQGAEEVAVAARGEGACGWEAAGGDAVSWMILRRRRLGSGARNGWGRKRVWEEREREGESISRGAHDWQASLDWPILAIEGANLASHIA
uniref:Uncharacterized protein n=1 Tax=Oryza meridionalis TaxID=40149 RepID=A0A0E0EMB9_9ORYZ